MMERLFILLTFLPFALSAQITINADNMPQAGDEFFYTELTTGTVDFASTGEGFTWDYASLLEENQNVDNYVGVGDTPFLYQLFFNNGFLYPEHQADVAISIGDIAAGPLTLSDMYNYYKNDEAGYRQVGYGATINGIPQSYRFEEIEWVYEFPMNFGDNFDGTSFVEMEVPTLGYRSSERQISTEVDGYGTVNLPSGSFEVLRVKKVIDQVDSLYNETLQIGFNIPVPQVIEYHWVAENEVAPVLLVTESNGQITSVKFRIEEPFGVYELNPTSTIVGPNPAKDFIQISIGRNEVVQDIHLLNAMGQQVLVKKALGSSNIQLDVSNLAKGLYSLLIRNKEGSTSTHSIVID